MPTIICDYCGSPFHVKPSRIGKVRFCSNACRGPGSRIPVEQRVMDKIDIDSDTGCWNWTSKINDNGYGLIASVVETGKRPIEQRAHRVVYEMHKGPIPEGLDLDHLCRNRKCVNPDHLEPVSRAENLRRGSSEHSRGKTHCKRGHEFTPENTYWTKAGYRNCLACRPLYYKGLA
jgi:hypothetical protein